LELQLVVLDRLLKATTKKRGQLFEEKSAPPDKILATLNSWFQHSFYRDWTTATHCCHVCQGQLFSLGNVRVMNAAAGDIVYCTTMWN